jgi:uncharacterized membrane protein YgcG
MRVAEAWRLGREADDGVPWWWRRTTGRCASRWIRRGRHPDAVAKRVIAEVIVPHFRQDFHGGIRAGIGQLIRLSTVNRCRAPAGLAHWSATIDFFEKIRPWACCSCFWAAGLLRGCWPRPRFGGGVVAFFGVAAADLSSRTVVALIVFLLTLGGGGRRSHRRSGGGGFGAEEVSAAVAAGFSGGGGSFGEEGIADGERSTDSQTPVCAGMGGGGAFPTASWPTSRRPFASRSAGTPGKLPWKALDMGVAAGRDGEAEAISCFLTLSDTEANNGVLIYLLLADRDVEIVADRGLNHLVAAEDWEVICRQMEQDFRQGRFREGVLAGIAAVSGLLIRHFPPTGVNLNELPDRPVRLG